MKLESHGGGLKMDWTEPLRRNGPMGIESFVRGRKEARGGRRRNRRV